MERPKPVGSKARSLSVEEALKILREPSPASLDFDPINSIFVNHAKERRTQMKMSRDTSNSGKIGKMCPLIIRDFTNISMKLGYINLNIVISLIYGLVGV